MTIYTISLLAISLVLGALALFNWLNRQNQPGKMPSVTIDEVKQEIKTIRADFRHANWNRLTDDQKPLCSKAIKLCYEHDKLFRKKTANLEGLIAFRDELANLKTAMNLETLPDRIAI